MSYIPPIGIPAPSFGIDEVAPAWPGGWPATQVANWYYVEPDHPDSTDVANTNGYPNKPRKTIPRGDWWRMMTFTAGCVVEVHGGVHEAGVVPTDGSPSALSPVFIRGFDGAEFSSGLSLGHHDGYTCQYVIVEGFKMPTAKIVGTTNHHCVIRYCEVTKPTAGTSESLIVITPAQGSELHNAVIFRCWIHNAGDIEATADVDNHGIDVSMYSRTAPSALHDVWVLENHFDHLSGDGTQLNGAETGNDGIQRVYFGKNTAHTNRQSGFWSKQSKDCVVSQNRIWAMTERSVSQPGNGIGYQYGAHNLWILFNEVYGCCYGIRQSSTNDALASYTYIIGNYVHNLIQITTSQAWGSPYGAGIAFWAGGSTRYVIDNTIVLAYIGIYEPQLGTTTISGNLIGELKPNESFNVGTYGAYEFHYTLSPRAELIAENMLMHGPAGAVISYASGDRTLSYIVSNTDYGDTWLDEAPVMSGVFLTTAHTNIASNTEHAVYDTFETLYGRDIRFGFDGRPRTALSNRVVGAVDVRNLISDPVSGPTITVQPQDINATDPNEYQELSITATSSFAISYQWFKNNVAIDGAEWFRLGLYDATTADNGEYYCIATDSFGSTQSDTVTVIIPESPIVLPATPTLTAERHFTPVTPP